VSVVEESAQHNKEERLAPLCYFHNKSARFFIQIRAFGAATGPNLILR
jgi:hypothetical protein